VADRRQALVVLGAFQIPADPVEDLLGGGQVAGGLDDEYPVGARADHVLLPVGPHIVDTGVGPGVGQAHQRVVEAECEAIDHGCLPKR
jgi:hypothetical protein